MLRRTLPASLITCLILSCGRSQAIRRNGGFGALRAKVGLGATRQALVGPGGKSMAMTGGVAAFLSASSAPTCHLQRRMMQRSIDLRRSSTILPALVNPSTLPPNHHHNTVPRRKAIAFLSMSSDGSDEAAQGISEEQQKGMDDAFASLEALTLEQWGEANSNDNADVPVTDVRYSRTDDTPALDSGKSTEEEVGLYLEMQGELEGTTISEDDSDQNGDRIEELVFEDGTSVDLSDEVENEDEYPWTSINPILRLRGPVASGYGRGGKKLGVPTANLPASLFQSALEDVSNGVYFGWAVVESGDAKKGRNAPVKAVVNVGYSPTFEGQENKEKIVEAHLITKDSPMEMNEMAAATYGEEQSDAADVEEIEGDFYEETMRLQLIGYLRPEQKFDSFPELIAQIHRDIGNANWALDSMPFIFSKEDEFVKNGAGWVGSGGGDVIASWEYESW